MIRNEWVLDVLADIKSFAVANNLTALADQLDQTRQIAAAEIASQPEDGTLESYVDARAIGYDTGRLDCVNRA
jgi:hypothetical protein